MQLSNLLAGIYLVLNGIEWLYLICQPAMRPVSGGKAAKLRLQDRVPRSLFPNRASDRGVKKAMLLSASTMCASGSVLIVLSASNVASATASVSALISLMAFNALFAFGLEGSDQMMGLVLTSNAISAIWPALTMACESFIAVQLVLSYAVAGIAKLLSFEWRSGTAVITILATRSFGPGDAQWLEDHSKVARAICLGVIAFELVWLIAPVDIKLLSIVMMVGVIFHFANAWIMGLNLFPWAFLSAYPLAFIAISRLHQCWPVFTGCLSEIKITLNRLY